MATPRQPPEVWFRPNIGSTDMIELFTEPDRWASARPEVGVFGFYALQVASSDYPCPQCGRNRLPNLSRAGAFSALRAWSIGIDVETPAITPGDCGAVSSAALARDVLRSLRAEGASVASLSVDEPLYAAQSCGGAAAAAHMADFTRAVRAESPGVVVGDVEPYPALGIAAILAWTDALRAAGVPPAFLHVDVDRVRAVQTRADLDGDLRALGAGLAQRQIPFGVILWGADGTDDAGYVADVLGWTGRVKTALGTPARVIFQSWSVSADGGKDVPVNLPDDDPARPTHTRLIRDGLALLRQAPAP